MITPNIEPIIYSTIKSEEAPPKEHYFYCYKYTMNGSWFSTMLYDTPEKAQQSMTDKQIIRKKLCCVVL